jgi:hypothetical protein
MRTYRTLFVRSSTTVVDVARLYAWLAQLRNQTVFI